MGKKKEEIEDVEIQEAPAVNPVVEIKAKVDSVLADRVAALVMEFEKTREQGLEELASLNQSLESLKGQKSKLVAEKNGLMVSSMGYGAKGVADLDQRINWLSKQIKGCEDQATSIFSRLTELPKLDFPFLNFLVRWKP
jgi:chaperonin cofactor prefoldin